MAGSYNHCVDATGKLLVSEQLQGMLECCSGDVYEAIQEMYGMIWGLAGYVEKYAGIPASAVVELCRQTYEDGLRFSPGIDGRLPEEDDDEGFEQR